MVKIKIRSYKKNYAHSRQEERAKNKDSTFETSEVNQFEENTSNISVIKDELNNLVGLNNIKETVEELSAFLEIQRRRRKEKLATDSQVLHMIFKGNPGTGKTTVARILGRLFKELGVLSKGHSQEVERADLVGEYIGHTAQKTREQIKKAAGGILFIDEAYSLARGGSKDFGREAIDALVKGMEDNKDNFILILAGYREEMLYFIETNPGLRSRFPIQIDFYDYTTDELMEIAYLMLEERQYYLDTSGKAELRFVIERLTKKHMHSGNARLVRNLIERAIRLHAVRLIKKDKCSREELMTVTRKDIAGAGDCF